MEKQLGQIVLNPEFIESEVGILHYNLGKCPNCNHRITLTKEGIQEFNRNAFIKLKTKRFKEFIWKIIQKIQKLMRLRIVLQDDATEK